MDADIVSGGALIVGPAGAVSVDAEWTDGGGTAATGTIKVEAFNDPALNTAAVGAAGLYAVGSMPTNPAADAGRSVDQWYVVGFRFWRVVWDDTSGDALNLLTVYTFSR